MTADLEEAMLVAEEKHKMSIPSIFSGNLKNQVKFVDADSRQFHPTETLDI